MLVRLSPAVRIIPPSEAMGKQWVAEHLLARRRYKLSPPAAAALVASCRPQNLRDLAKRLTENGSYPGSSIGYWEDLIDLLTKRGLIIDASLVEHDPRLKWLIKLRKSWSRFGWREAAEYHTLSFDYPCVDYSTPTAISVDRGRMLGYQSVEPDTNRFKLEYLQGRGVPLPEPAAEMPSGTARTVWADAQKPVPVDFALLSKIISLAFGATGFLVPRTQSAPLLRRSSPSGGGRHPSEGYVIIRRVPEVEPGWYHITMRPLSLRTLEGVPIDDGSLRQLFPETMERFPFDIRALVVITSMFERNMYRYREPRTFRTVHMDAGHIAASLRIAARSFGLTAGIYYCDFATRIEEALGLDGMQEGYMVTVAIADGVGDPLQRSDPAPALQRTRDGILGSAF